MRRSGRNLSGQRCGCTQMCRPHSGTQMSSVHRRLSLQKLTGSWIHCPATQVSTVHGLPSSQSIGSVTHPLGVHLGVRHGSFVSHKSLLGVCTQPSCAVARVHRAVDVVVAIACRVDALVVHAGVDGRRRCGRRSRRRCGTRPDRGVLTPRIRVAPVVRAGVAVVAVGVGATPVAVGIRGVHTACPAGRTCRPCRRCRRRSPRPPFTHRARTTDRLGAGVTVVFTWHRPHAPQLLGSVCRLTLTASPCAR